MFIWDPRYGVKNTHRKSLVQCIDISATLLGFFGQKLPKDMMGRDLSPVITADEKIRDYAIFGMFAGHVNITDGKYVYMRAPISEDNKPCFEYTLMPTDMNSRKPLAQLKAATLADPFPFTKELPVLKLPASAHFSAYRFGDMLFDVEHDPLQLHPLQDSQKEKELQKALRTEMGAVDAPQEQYERLGI